MTDGPEIILASSSPRRQEFLAALGVPFRVIPPEIHEIPEPGEAPEAFARRAAADKARWTADRTARECRTRPLVIVGADTIVTLDGHILGKPRDAAEARAMLRALSGRTHRVITAVCVLGGMDPAALRERAFAVSSEVDFKSLSDREIDAYITTGEPMDKAGAYAVQGRASYMIRAVRGSYTNVVGLPLCELIELLVTDFGWAWF